MEEDFTIGYHETQEDFLKRVLKNTVTYKVTTELKTPWWLKLLRFFRIKDKRQEFEIVFKKDWFRIGDVIDNGGCDIKIVGHKK